MPTRVAVVGPFPPSQTAITSGSQIRAFYIAQELEKAGLSVSRVPRDISPRAPRSFISIGWTIASIKRADVVCVVGVPLHGLPSVLLARLAQDEKPLAFDFNDDPILQYNAMFGSDHPHRRSLAAQQRRLFEMASLVVFVTDSMREFYSHAIPKGQQCRTIVVPNGTDPDHFVPSPPPVSPTIGFIGGIGGGRGLGIVPEVVDILARSGRDVHAMIASHATGAPSLEFLSALRESALRHNPGRILFSDNVGYADAPRFLARLSVCLIPHKRNRYMDMAAPIKLFDYMAAGRPIVATDNPEQARIIEQSKAGKACSETASSFADAIGELLDNEVEAREMGEAGRRAAERQYSWKARVRSLADALIALS